LVREIVENNNIEVLLVQRNSRLVFHGGHWVFPGGRVDAADFEDSESGFEYQAALKAAVRETKEEAGIDIDEKLLIHTAHWTTPPKQPRRFCTWFFIYPLTASVNVKVDNDEILDHRWISPSDALAEEKAENIVLPGPTSSTLRDIANHRNLNDLIAEVTSTKIRVFPKDSAYYRPEEMGVSRN